MAKTYNIFISHSWSYSDNYQRLINLLKKDPTFNFKDYSVPKDDPIHSANSDKQLYTAIKGQILPCSIIIILAGVYSSYSKWIEKEIEIAKSYPYTKKIIAIDPWGAERTSVIAKENAHKVVKWNTSSIVSAIKELSGD